MGQTKRSSRACETTDKEMHEKPAPELLEGRVFNIQRFSTEDGPGIRTTVFFKGCPLRCVWCHNPEGLAPQPQLLWYANRCIGARDCLRACPESALELTSRGIQIDRKRCQSCGRCEEACPAAALQVVGKTWSVEKLISEVKKDEAFYRNSGGGVTLGGGEPMMQPAFVTAFLKSCKAERLSTALDTSGCAAWKHYAAALRFVDLVLLDLKQMDPARHRAMTGVELEPILENARRFGEWNGPVWVRTPIIPGYTDSPENVAEVARFIARNMPNVERYDLLAFNNLCIGQYERLGIPFLLKDTALVPRQQMEELKAVAEKCGVRNVQTSGATRLEPSPTLSEA